VTGRRRAFSRDTFFPSSDFPPEQLREIRAIEALGYIATPEAKLAEGEPEARLTQEAKASLGRLSRPGD
jgi:hypothetical protein